jgi:hypothetical protein
MSVALKILETDDSVFKTSVRNLHRTSRPGLAFLLRHMRGSNVGQDTLGDQGKSMRLTGENSIGNGVRCGSTAFPVKHEVDLNNI